MPDDRRPSSEELFNPELATSAWRRRLKASEAGRIAAALFRRRRLPKQVLRAPGGRRGTGVTAGVPAPADRRRVRAVVWIPAGPGGFEGLVEAWRSVAASSPGEVALLVTDDWTPDAHAAAVQAVEPGAIVVRTRVPSGGPPRLWPVVSVAMRAALAHFDFELLVKFDTDALAVGPGWVEGIMAAIERAQTAAPVRDAEDDGTPAAALDPAVPIGVAGAFVERPDGQHETDRDYHRRVLAGEAPHDARVAEWGRRAEAGGWPAGSIVQGGCLVMTRAFCDAVAAEGALAWRPRLRTIVSEDLLLTVLAYALGFRAASLGGPRGPFAIANKHLPLPLDELVDPASRWLVTHSTKVGLDGESEPAIRACVAEARAAWPTTS